MSSQGPRTRRGVPDPTQVLTSANRIIRSLVETIRNERSVRERPAPDGEPRPVSGPDEALFQSLADRLSAVSARLEQRETALRPTVDETARRLDVLWKSMTDKERKAAAFYLETNLRGPLPQQLPKRVREFINQARAAVDETARLGIWGDDFDGSYFPAPEGLRAYRVTKSKKTQKRGVPPSTIVYGVDDFTTPNLRSRVGSIEPIADSVDQGRWHWSLGSQISPGEALRRAAYRRMQRSAMHEAQAYIRELAGVLRRIAKERNDDRFSRAADRLMFELEAESRPPFSVGLILDRFVASLYRSPRFDWVTRTLNRFIGPVRPSAIESLLYRYVVSMTLALPVTVIKDLLGTTFMQAAPGHLRAMITAYVTMRKRDRRLAAALYGLDAVAQGYALSMAPDAVPPVPIRRRVAGSLADPKGVAKDLVEWFPSAMLTGTRAADRIGGAVSLVSSMINLVGRGYRPTALISIDDDVPVERVSHASALYAAMTIGRMNAELERIRAAGSAKIASATSEADRESARAEMVADMMEVLDAIDADAAVRWTAAMKKAGIDPGKYMVMSPHGMSSDEILKMLTVGREGDSNREKWIPVGGTLERGVWNDITWRVYYQLPFHRPPINMTHPELSRWGMTFWNWAYNYTLMSISLTKMAASEMMDALRGLRSRYRGGPDVLEFEAGTGTGKRVVRTEVVGAKHLGSPSMVLAEMVGASIVLGGVVGAMSSIPVLLAARYGYEAFIGPGLLDDPETVEGKLERGRVSSWVMAPLDPRAKAAYTAGTMLSYGMAQLQAAVMGLVNYSTGGDYDVLSTYGGTIGPFDPGTTSGAGQDRLLFPARVSADLVGNMGMLAGVVAPWVLRTFGYDPREFGARRTGTLRVPHRVLTGYRRSASGLRPMEFLFSWSPTARGKTTAGGGVLRRTDPAAAATMLALAIRKRNEAMAKYAEAMEALAKGDEEAAERAGEAIAEMQQSAAEAAAAEIRRWESIAAKIANMREVTYEEVADAIMEMAGNPMGHAGFMPSDLGMMYSIYANLHAIQDYYQMPMMASMAVQQLVESGAVRIEKVEGRAVPVVRDNILERLARQYYFEVTARVVGGSGLKDVIDQLSASENEVDRRFAERLSSSVLLRMATGRQPTGTDRLLGIETPLGRGVGRNQPPVSWIRIFKSAVRSYLSRHADDLAGRITHGNTRSGE